MFFVFQKRLLWNKNHKNQNFSQRGIAFFEVLPLLVIFVVLVGVLVGLWGAIHSGILQSISARHYAFEVLNNRTHFEWHRDYDGTLSPQPMIGSQNSSQEDLSAFHRDMHMRFFAVRSDKLAAFDPSQVEEIVTTRGINFFHEISRAPSDNPQGLIDAFKGQSGDDQFHRDVWVQEDAVPVNPLWIMVGYGICLDADCGNPSPE